MLWTGGCIVITRPEDIAFEPDVMLPNKPPCDLLLGGAPAKLFLAAVGVCESGSCCCCCFCCRRVA